jgi:hypothetical protein
MAVQGAMQTHVSTRAANTDKAVVLPHVMLPQRRCHINAPSSSSNNNRVSEGCGAPSQLWSRPPVHPQAHCHTPEAVQLLAGLGVPYAHGAITTARQHLAAVTAVQNVLRKARKGTQLV